jgi:hypothetical protein
MKEKRVDYYLALASLFQILTIGFGSAFFTELIKEDPNEIVLYPTFTIAVVCAFGAFVYYSHANKLTKKLVL